MNTAAQPTAERISKLKEKIQQKRNQVGVQQHANIIAFDKFEKGFHNKNVWRDGSK